MAAVLTGLEVKSSGDFVGELVEGELRPLDCAESIIKEAADLLHPSSGASETEEPVVGCKKRSTFEENSRHTQEDILGVVVRPTNAKKHFSKMWLVPESDTDTDIDGPGDSNSVVSNTQNLPPPAVDFSKFLKS